MKFHSIYHGFYYLLFDPTDEPILGQMKAVLTDIKQLYDKQRIFTWFFV